MIDGRLIFGVAAGSSRADHEAVGVPFDERWVRFDGACRELRAVLGDETVPSPSTGDPTSTMWTAPRSDRSSAQAGPAMIRDVVTRAGFTQFRVAAQTPFSDVFEVRG